MNEAERNKPQIEQRLAARPTGQPAFPREEADQQRDPGGYAEQGAGIAPAVLACLDQAVGHRHQPAAEAATPTGSIPGCSAARDSGTRTATVARPIRTTGTLIRNTQPHQ